MALHQDDSEGGGGDALRAVAHTPRDGSGRWHDLATRLRATARLARARAESSAREARPTRPGCYTPTPTVGAIGSRALAWRQPRQGLPRGVRKGRVRVQAPPRIRRDQEPPQSLPAPCGEGVRRAGHKGGHLKPRPGGALLAMGLLSSHGVPPRPGSLEARPREGDGILEGPAAEHLRAPPPRGSSWPRRKARTPA